MLRINLIVKCLGDRMNIVNRNPSWRDSLYHEDFYDDSWYDDALYHHGVKGMKWGVRRNQNKKNTVVKKAHHLGYNVGKAIRPRNTDPHNAIDRHIRKTIKNASNDIKPKNYKPRNIIDKSMRAFAGGIADAYRENSRSYKKRRNLEG